MTDWVQATISERRAWADGLITLRFEAPRFDFEPGQFVNLALDLPQGRVKRSYSLASAPGHALEFYLARVEAGELTPRLFELQPGQSVWLEPAPQGFFTLRWVPEQARDLWLLATGTGLGPFVSLWRSPEWATRFERVIVAHSVRRAADLAYRGEMEALVARDPRVRYVPLVSRETPARGLLRGRIPAAIADGSLERAAGCALDPERSHLMLCGNPAMLSDTTTVLESRGLRKHRVRSPGHITTEKYW